MLALIIQIPEWGNATILEISWTLIGAITLAVVTWNISGAKANLSVPLDLNDEYELAAARLIRRGYIRREIVRFFTAGLILATGVTGDIVASANHPSVTTVTGLVTTGAFFLIGLMTTIQSIFDGHDRGDVRDLLIQSRRYQADTVWESTKRDVGFDEDLVD